MKALVDTNLLTLGIVSRIHVELHERSPSLPLLDQVNARCNDFSSRTQVDPMPLDQILDKNKQTANLEEKKNESTCGSKQL